jgi:hypothetical protein
LLGLLVLAVCFACPVEAGAGLQFKSQRIEFRVAPDQQRVKAKFAFINEGGAAVRIEAVQTDCSCLKAQAPEDEIPPGGQGAVSAEFRVGSLRGVVEKHLWVKLREGGRVRRVLLNAVLVVPDLVELEPRKLGWAGGEDPGEKSFRVRMTCDEEVHLLDVTCSRPGFAFRVETIDAGREYLVHAKPLNVESTTIALVRFVTDCRHEKFRTPVGFVHVHRPR